MKTAIVFASMHHGNTKKLLDEIAKCDPEVMLIDTIKEKETDLSGFDRIGIASGVAFSKYYPEMLAFLEKNLPRSKEVFFMHTAGDPRENQNAAAKKIAEERDCKLLGTYFCKGFDTFGPFKLIGGIAKGHPNESELAGAVLFYKNLP